MSNSSEVEKCQLSDSHLRVQHHYFLNLLPLLRSTSVLSKARMVPLFQVLPGPPWPIQPLKETMNNQETEYAASQ